MAQLVAEPSAKSLRQLSVDFHEGDMHALEDLVAACRANKTLELLKVHVHEERLLKPVEAKLKELNNQRVAIYTPWLSSWRFSVW